MVPVTQAPHPIPTVAMKESLVVLTTAPSQEVASQLAHAAVEARLAACVQVLGPIQSTYWWEGKVQSDAEWLCLLKTTAAAYPDLEQTLRQAHPYDEPEIIALPITAGSAGYLNWLAGETQRDRS